MHILYLHQNFNIPKNGGSIRSYEISKSLINKGHKISMITSYAKFPDLKKKKLNLNE